MQMGENEYGQIPACLVIDEPGSLYVCDAHYGGCLCHFTWDDRWNTSIWEQKNKEKLKEKL